VRKGEHGTKVYFVKQLQVRERGEPNEGEDAMRIVPIMREYTVFNVAQCENLPDRLVHPVGKPERNKDTRDAIALLLCAEFDFDGDLRHAGYIENWIAFLKSDKRAFFAACSKAQQAADCLRGLALAEPHQAAA
jgi:antirestriction protein ArdC